MMAIDESKYEGLDKDKTVVNLYMQIKTHTKEEGPVQMVSLIVLKIQCSPEKPLTVTAKQICDIVSWIFVIQSMYEDLFKCIVLLNSLKNLQYFAVQTQVSCSLANSTTANPYKLDNIWKLFETVQNLTHLKTSSSGLSTDTALTAFTWGHFCSLKPNLPSHDHAARVKCCATYTTHN